MISSVLAASLALIVPQEAATDQRPPRPTDESMFEAVQAAVPQGRILSSAFHDSPRGGARYACGMVELDGVVEPYSAFLRWSEPLFPASMAPRIILPGKTEPEPYVPEPSQWKVSVNVPTHSDEDGDGFDRHDRNRDAYERRVAIMGCDDLRPPEGVNWVTEREPDPDPARQRRNEERAKALTDLIFGAG